MAVAERAPPTREEAATTATALVSARANLLLAKIEGPSRAMLRRFPRNEPASSMATTEVVKVVADGSGAADRKLFGQNRIRHSSVDQSALWRRVSRAEDLRAYPAPCSRLHPRFGRVELGAGNGPEGPF